MKLKKHIWPFTVTLEKARDHPTPSLFLAFMTDTNWIDLSCGGGWGSDWKYWSLCDPEWWLKAKRRLWSFTSFTRLVLRPFMIEIPILSDVSKNRMGRKTNCFFVSFLTKGSESSLSFVRKWYRYTFFEKVGKIIIWQVSAFICEKKGSETYGFWFF